MSSGRVHPPFSLARSTGGESQSLLSALLVAGKLDEISNAEDYAAVERYVKSAGKADETGKTTSGVAFWLYPTGLHGPYHVGDDGAVQQHGILVTAEPGVVVGDVVQKARAVPLTENKLVHEHIAAA